MENLNIWNAVKEVPREAQKKIKGGRLSGMTDISPQWRMFAMTEKFGPIGIGWYYTIDKQWTEQGSEDQICAFTNIRLYIKDGESWSAPIQGQGGNMLVVKESRGLHTSDEAFKMSLTDALSVAMKQLGVGSNIYSGGNDYGKYTQPIEQSSSITEQQTADLLALIAEVGADENKFCAYFNVQSVAAIPDKKFNVAVKMLEAKRKAS